MLFVVVHLFFCGFFFWKNFQEIDSNKDGYVSPEEILDIKYDDLERLLSYAEEDEEPGGEEENLNGTEEQDTEPEETTQHTAEGKPDNTDHDHTEL